MPKLTVKNLLLIAAGLSLTASAASLIVKKMSQKNREKEQTPVQKEMQNIAIKPQVKTDMFIKMP